MIARRPLSALVGLLLWLGSGQLTHGQNCAAPAEWFPRTTQPDNHEPTPGQSCEFYQWAWQTFLFITQADEAGGAPRFLGFDTPADVFADHAQPGSPSAGNKMLRLSPIVAKQTGIGSVDGVFQATTNGVLVDPHGRAVCYGLHANSTFVGFLQGAGLTNPQAILTADPQLAFPTGSLELKSAWRIVEAGEDTSSFLVRQAQVPILAADASGKLTIDFSQAPVEKTVALVGLHVVGVTDEHPEFIWATFEHRANAPDLPAGVTPQSAVDVTNGSTWTFCPQGTLANACNRNNRNQVHLVDAAAQTLAPQTPVFRQFPFGNDPDAASILALNQSVHDQLPEELAVWKNYNLIGALWLKHIGPVIDILDRHQPLQVGDEAGSIRLANSTMETFGQSQNCFQCHNTQQLPVPGTTTVLPAMNINISHFLERAFPLAPAVGPAAALAISQPENRAALSAHPVTGPNHRVGAAPGVQPNPLVGLMRIAILVGLAILLVLAVVGVVRQFLQAATAAHAEGGIVGLGPQYFFWLDVLYLVILLLLAILYLASSTGLRELVPPIVAGVLPIGVPWFGAIGAVLVGLQGVFEHANQDTARHPERAWESSYNYWHLARPLSGAVLATIAFFMFVLLNVASGLPPKFISTPNAWAVTDVLAYFVFAFLIGYREKTFRDLVAKVADVILGPYDNKSNPGNGGTPHAHGAEGGVNAEAAGGGHVGGDAPAAEGAVEGAPGAG